MDLGVKGKMRDGVDVNELSERMVLIKNKSIGLYVRINIKEGIAYLIMRS